MASITLSVSEEFKARIMSFPWINWSEISREESRKKEIFEEYMKSHKLSPEDQEFCDKIDWHPVDELPMKKEFIEELKKARNEPAGKPMTLKELHKLLGLK